MAKDKLAEKELMEKNLLESEAAVKQILADKDNIIERLGKIMTIWSTVSSLVRDNILCSLTIFW
jgi:hypothetical protein